MTDSIIVRAHQHSAGGMGKGGGTVARAIGRSRGKPPTRIAMLAGNENTAIAEWRRSDAMLDHLRMVGTRRVVGCIDEVLADEGFVSDEIRDACLGHRDALPTIPNTSRKRPRPFAETKGAKIGQAYAIPIVSDPRPEVPRAV